MGFPIPRPVRDCGSRRGPSRRRGARAAVAVLHDNVEARRPRIHAASSRDLQPFLRAPRYGETTVIVPFMPASCVGTDRNGTVPGPANSTKNRVVLPGTRSWLYVVPLLV